MPGCNVPILNIPKAQALWNNGFKTALKKKANHGVELQCPMCHN
jgi:hypothetical protein